MKKDQTLSEAFLAVRPFLWDGIEKRNGKDAWICNATTSTCNKKAISKAHAWLIELSNEFAKQY